MHIKLLKWSYCVWLVVCVLTISEANATVHTIFTNSTFFTPLNTVVFRGDTVRWQISGNHSTTSTSQSPKQWNSGIMSSGTFILPVLLTDPVGNYPYICILHSIEMRDTLRVVGVSNCCVPPIRGNTTGDASELVNVLDLNYLIAYMFSGGRPPACLEEGNINADGGINVLDVNFLVTYMFSGGPAPVACP